MNASQKIQNLHEGRLISFLMILIVSTIITMIVSDWIVPIMVLMMSVNSTAICVAVIATQIYPRKIFLVGVIGGFLLGYPLVSLIMHSDPLSKGYCFMMNTGVFLIMISFVGQLFDNKIQQIIVENIPKDS